MTQLLERLGSKVTSMVLPEEEAFACIPPEYWSECDLVYNFAQHVYYYELFHCHTNCSGNAVCSFAGFC